VTTRTGVTTTSYQAPKRDWLLGLHGTDPGSNPTATLDVSMFTAGTHYPNGYIPSGTMVSRVASGLWGPLDTTATGLEHGLTIGDVTVNAADLTADAATGVLKHGFVAYAKLPAGGRAVVGTARTAMPGIDFADITP
jgi:hypothetical protein